MEEQTAVTDPNRAFSLHEEIKQIRNQAEKVVQMCTFELGQRLKEMRDNKLYSQLGFQSFIAYLNDPELQFSQATAYNAIAIYEKYQLKLAIPDGEILGISVRRLIELLPVINSENVTDWLSKAKTLSYVDLKKELHEFKEAGLTVKTELVPFPKIVHCPSCGGWKIESDNLCTCLPITT